PAEAKMRFRSIFAECCDSSKRRKFRFQSTLVLVCSGDWYGSDFEETAFGRHTNNPSVLRRLSGAPSLGQLEDGRVGVENGLSALVTTRMYCGHPPSPTNELASLILKDDNGARQR